VHSKFCNVARNRHCPRPSLWANASETALRKVIRGQDDSILLALSLCWRAWHLLLEGVPGGARTTLVQALARASTALFSGTVHHDCCRRRSLESRSTAAIEQQLRFKRGADFLLMVLLAAKNKKDSTGPLRRRNLHFSKPNKASDVRRALLLAPATFPGNLPRKPGGAPRTYPLPESPT